MSFFQNSENIVWSAPKKWLLRFFFVFFLLLIIPLSPEYLQHVFTTNWLHSNFYDWFLLTTYVPEFFCVKGLASWGIAAVVAVVVATVWFTVVKDKDTRDDDIYYWLRVVLRYRLAIGVIAFGLIKLFPLQMPYPSLSNLHTNYGDFLPWKIYFHTLAIAQPYEVFLGAVEVIAGLLLLKRSFAIVGAGIIVGFTGNVFASNLAYDIGHLEYSLLLTLFAAAIALYDAPRLFSLLILQKKAIANRYQPVFAGKLSTVRKGLQVLTLIFIGILTVSVSFNYKNHPYKLPQTPGLHDSYGYYNVREFKLNHEEIPYSATDLNRWQNVIFEKWATISIKTAKPIIIDNSIGDDYQEKDIYRNYESAGVGGRRYFAYETDPDNQVISLTNKNPNHRTETFTLKYDFLNDSTIVLQGVNEQKDSVYVVLDKIERKYMLYEGRRKPVKL